MMLQLTPVEILAALGGLIALVMVWRASARATRRATEAARASVRLMSLAGRVVVTAAAIVGVQWIVITHPGNTTLLLAVLGVPALFASYTLTKALTVTTMDVPQQRKGRRQ
ncbi:hypothetical protein [Saccharopolyspora sp. ASAGF58]|uniref:hypothetical protein n=1 Tax=Saccharopolyspora sp. ASAGF58 TaxID=2719023 RepID=UPI00143FB91A|nr:hypothetical protein [Saccharopolyspora sp. ASAGF58]QIZ37874.1 hypothetical protein FDZ84_29030 [Saccharopolyspora sp. ASAGF58]